MEEHPAFNRGVAGSNPAGPVIKYGCVNMEEKTLTLETANNLIHIAERILREGDVGKYLYMIRESMITSLKIGLYRLGLRPLYENIHRLYLQIPYMYRPSVGEPELEEFEFRYGIITSNLTKSIPVDERFLDASKELAERIYFWAESTVKACDEKWKNGKVRST